MNKDLKIMLETKLVNEGFIKVTETPSKQLTSEQKALLNRKGNMYFNAGEINNARRIFLATGYSDGLTRIGDNFMKIGDEISALKYYWLAHNKKKAAVVIEKTAQFISAMLSEKD